MKILVNVIYSDNTNKYWFDSSIKNKIVEFNPEEKSIHDLIAELCKNEGMELSYKNKPQSNIFVDTSNGSKIVGYVYRGKSELYDDNVRKYKTINFDVWVNIDTIIDFEFEEILF